MIIICDTLRKDVLGLYGGEAKTPFLNALAREANVYANAIAPSPWTYPSHVSLFTGLYPNEHGVHETEKVKLLNITKYHRELKAERLAETMQRAGYNTYGISSNIMVSPLSEFDIGFQSFLTLDPAPKMSESKTFLEARKLGASPGVIAKTLIKQGKFGDLIRYARAWRKINHLNKALNYPLEKGAALTNDLIANSKIESKFFYFINYVEMHEPYKGYQPKETWDNFTGIRKISDGKVKYLKSQYIAEAEHMDRALGQLIGILKRKDYYDNTLLIITSDHGQAFNEHGYMYHNTYLYDEITRIPMIIKFPGNKKFKKKEGYQSLTSIPKLVKEAIEGGDDSSLIKESAFSEAYGDVTMLPGGYSDRKRYVKEKYEKIRKAIYKDGFKLTVNGTDGTSEEFSENGKKLEPSDRPEKFKELVEDLEIFKGKEKFVLPQTES